jgi:hypothetical protein
VACKIIYVSGEAGPDPTKDPLLQVLCLDSSIELYTLVAKQEMSPSEVAEFICQQAEGPQLDHIDNIVVVLNVFLEPTKEGVHPKEPWDPDAKSLQDYLQVGSYSRERSCLKSLEVMSDIWADLRGRAKILVTTDGVRLSRRSRLAIDHAFGDGKISSVYNWQDSSLKVLADDLETRIRQCLSSSVSVPN